MLLAAFLKQSVSDLSPLYGEPEARNIVLMLCESLLGTKSYTHITEPEFLISPEAQPALSAALERLKKGEPIQYVLGRAHFFGRSFHVAPGVLIPRPETELLISEALKIADGRPFRVLDLCTGSGCIAWTMALELPGSAVVGTDISEEALCIARSQDFAPAPVFVCSDVLDIGQEFPYGPFDLILSNPPYIMESEKAQMRPNVLDYEPSLALFVPDADPLLYYRAVADWAGRFLAPGGSVIVEINERLGDHTRRLFMDKGFTHSVILEDISSKPRILINSK